MKKIYFLIVLMVSFAGCCVMLLNKPPSADNPIAKNLTISNNQSELPMVITHDLSISQQIDQICKNEPVIINSLYLANSSGKDQTSLSALKYHQVEYGINNGINAKFEIKAVARAGVIYEGSYSFNAEITGMQKNMRNCGKIKIITKGMEAGYFTPQIV